MTNERYIRIHLGDHKALAPEPVTSIDDAASQVTILDADNDLRLDFFGEIRVIIPDNTPTPASPNISTTTATTNLMDPNSTTTVLKRVFWVNKGDGMFERRDDPYGTHPLMSPHSSAFVGMSSLSLCLFSFSLSYSFTPLPFLFSLY